MKRLFLIGIVFLISTGIVLALEAKKEEPASPPPFGEVHHLGWVVKDMDKAIEYWKKVGVSDFSVRKNSHSGQHHIYRGKKMEAVYHMAFAHIGDVLIEMFEPVKGGSPYSEFLENHGEGIQHIGFALNSYEELKSQVKRLQGLGIEIQEQGHWETDEGNA
ncbi:VOC family protein, partial [bacterium]|nr:VOC family protein [bacterium]